jgi:hypothetical protein
MATQENAKLRTITLTDRAPVRVREDRWPVIAEALAYNDTIVSQATRSWTLKVRRHADGRSIVYGVFKTAFRHEHDWRGGELLHGKDELIAAIRRVGARFPEHVVDECIANLPPEEI